MTSPWLGVCKLPPLTRGARTTQARSDILIPLSSHHAIALDQLANAVIQRPLGLEARLPQPLARHDVVALVGVLADLGEMDEEARHVLA